MYNDLFSIGPFTVHGYGLMITIGVLAALFIAEARAKKRDINADVLYPLTLVCVGFGFAGAKVLFCIVEWRQFFKNPWQLLTGNGFVVLSAACWQRFCTAGSRNLISGIILILYFPVWRWHRVLGGLDVFLRAAAMAGKRIPFSELHSHIPIMRQTA